MVSFVDMSVLVPLHVSGVCLWGCFFSPGVVVFAALRVVGTYIHYPPFPAAIALATYFVGLVAAAAAAAAALVAPDGRFPELCGLREGRAGWVPLSRPSLPPPLTPAPPGHAGCMERLAQSSRRSFLLVRPAGTNIEVSQRGRAKARYFVRESVYFLRENGPLCGKTVLCAGKRVEGRGTRERERERAAGCKKEEHPTAWRRVAHVHARTHDVLTTVFRPWMAVRSWFLPFILVLRVLAGAQRPQEGVRAVEMNSHSNQENYSVTAETAAARFLFFVFWKKKKKHVRVSLGSSDTCVGAGLSSRSYILTAK